MRYALIGCGRISPNHIMAARNNKLDMVAICDIDESCMDDKIRKFNIPETVKKYKDYKELLSTEQPELVAICTESGLHAKIAIDCINAGCNVIIEKPIALSIKDADAIIDAAEILYIFASPLITDLISLFRKSVMLWIRDVLESCSMVLHIFAGHVTGSTTLALPGEVPGHRMADVL